MRRRNGPTNWRTDGPSYRGALQHLKIIHFNSLLACMFIRAAIRSRRVNRRWRRSKKSTATSTWNWNTRKRTARTQPTLRSTALTSNLSSPNKTPHWWCQSESRVTSTCIWKCLFGWPYESSRTISPIRWQFFVRDGFAWADYSSLLKDFVVCGWVSVSVMSWSCTDHEILW